MDAALDIKTHTPTTSNPALVSNWAKGLGTFPDRDERIRNPKIRNQYYSAENTNSILGRTTVACPSRVMINFAESDNGMHNLFKAIDEVHLRTWNKIDFESASTTLKVDKKNSEIFFSNFLDSFGGEGNKELIHDYLAACRKMILLETSLRNHRGIASESNLFLIDENEKCSTSESAENLETELNEQRVIEALADPQWDFRTISGIAKETKLSLEFIENTLKKYSHKIRRSKVPNHNGEVLYTLNSRPETLREKLALWSIFIKKSL